MPADTKTAVSPNVVFQEVEGESVEANSEPLPMIKRLRQFSALTGRAKAELVQASLTIAAVALLLRLLGFAKARAILDRSSPTPPPQPQSGPADLTYARDLARLVRIAARHGPVKGACLHQSLALCWILQRRGIPVALRIGVHKGATFEAHAWLEIDGQPVNDSDDVADRFTAFERLHGLP